MSAEKSKKQKQISRKGIFGYDGLTLFGTSVLTGNSYAQIFATEPAKIALQLYTVREQIKQDIAGTLHKIAEVGFEALKPLFGPKIFQ
jgi:hypothetical protein